MPNPDDKTPNEDRTFSRTMNERMKERVKQVMGDFSLPKEVMTHMLKQVEETKEATLGIVSKEVRTFLENKDIAAIISDVLTKVSFELTMKARFVQNDKKAGFKLQVSPDFEKKTPETEVPADVPATAPPPEGTSQGQKTPSASTD